VKGFTGLNHMNEQHTIWAEKYRPSTLDTYIGNDQLKARVGKFIASGDVPHLLFSGPAGTGKTTLSKIITNSIDCDVLYINASDENSVETVRTKIKGFASSVGFKDLKVIILDESDYLSPNSQAALRNLMETFSKHTRFILTCNYVERIIDPLVSRTQQFQIVPPSKTEVGKHIISILNQESIIFDLKDVKMLIDAYYPDIRKIINECQLHVIGNELEVNQKEILQSDYKLKIIDILSSKSTDKKKKFQEIRQLLADSKIRDFTDFYQLLYSKIDDYAPNNISQVILAIAEGQFKDCMVVDKEICAMATLINILQVI
jgi:replication factor C small subunit